MSNMNTMRFRREATLQRQKDEAERLAQGLRNGVDGLFKALMGTAADGWEADAYVHRLNNACRKPKSRNGISTARDLLVGPGRAHAWLMRRLVVEHDPVKKCDVIVPMSDVAKRYDVFGVPVAALGGAR